MRSARSSWDVSGRARGARARRGRIERGTRELHVFRHVHEHRTRPPGLGDLERLLERAPQLVHIAHLHRVLHHGPEDRDSVHLLKRIRAEQRRGHLPRDRHERHGVEARVRERREQVGRAGSRRREADRCAARHARAALRDEAGGLLVAHEHVLQSTAPQRIVQRQVRAARHTGDVAHAAPFQEFADDLCSAVLLHGFSVVFGAHRRGDHARTPRQRTLAGFE